MTEENTIFSPTEHSAEIECSEQEEAQYQNPTAKKVMKWMDFALLLCRLLKSFLNKIFLWLDKWEVSMGNHK